MRVVVDTNSVLTRDRFRKYISLESVGDYVDWYIGISELVTVTQRLPVCRDPRDDKFLELALQGRATSVISGDADLLTLHPFRQIPIVRPAQFLRSLDALT